MCKLLCLLLINVSLNCNVKGYTSSNLDDKPNDENTNNEDSRNVVKTTLGNVRGFEEGDVVQFFDIPYGAFSAETPFQEPTSPAKWSLREIDDHRSRCPQLNASNTYIGDHECLTLSVFKPKDSESGSSTSAHDVLFHIHDSSFSSGSGSPLVYGPKYLVSEGIILVLPNYRLGPLGFLCLQNDTAPGNAALKDLTLALQWTVNNIEAFGGNSSNIAISGAGAGGALVEYLLLSHMSRPFISKAITESGSSVSPWAIDRHPLDTAKIYEENIAKVSKSWRENQNPLSFNGIDLEVLIRGAVNINFRPCIEREGGFITDTPWRLLQNQSLAIPYMSGSANQAAMDRAGRHTADSLSQLNNNIPLLLPNDLRFADNGDRFRTSRRVRTLYFQDRNITMASIRDLAQCYTDSQYVNPGIRSARLFVKGGANVYFYEFAFNTQTSTSAFIGSARGGSLSFVFGSSGGMTDDEQGMKNTMTELWASFIKTGKPATGNIEWNNLKEVAPAQEEWLYIGNELQMQRGLHINRLQLWQDIYENHFVENSNLGFANQPSLCILVATLAILTPLGAAKISTPYVLVF